MREIRAVGPMQLAGADALLYTVPAGMRLTITHIHITNPTGGAVTMFLSIGADTAANREYDGYSVAAGALLDHYPRLVLEAAETIRGHASAGASINLTLDGYLEAA